MRVTRQLDDRELDDEMSCHKRLGMKGSLAFLSLLHHFLLLLLDVSFLRTISQTQHEGTKKFSADVPWPSGSRDRSFFFMYFCLHRLVNPNGREI